MTNNSTKKIKLHLLQHCLFFLLPWGVGGCSSVQEKDLLQLYSEKTIFRKIYMSSSWVVLKVTLLCYKFLCPVCVEVVAWLYDMSVSEWGLGVTWGWGRQLPDDSMSTIPSVNADISHVLTWQRIWILAIHLTPTRASCKLHQAQSVRLTNSPPSMGQPPSPSP